jgi:hypothetical protein
MDHNEYLAYIKEIASTYGLSEPFVNIVVQEELKIKISAYLKYPVKITFNPKLMITGMPSVQGIIKEIEVSPNRIRGVLKRILIDIERILQLYKAKENMIAHSYLQGTLVHGKITQVHSNGTVLVDIPNVSILAFCPSPKQIKKEAGMLSVGEKRYFRVNRVSVEDMYDETQALLVLSRVSIELPSLLLLNFINNSWQIECIKRFSGIRSLLHSQYPIPKKFLYKTSEALCGEFIKVRYDR